MHDCDRRDFCKTLTCSLAGGWAVLAGLGKAMPAVAPDDVREEKGGEVMTAEKTTAVIARVKSRKGTCALGHRIGDETRFTESGVDGRICIHALYSMLPAVFAMLFDAKFPWLDDPDCKTHACPDAANPVVFEITRVREG